MPLLKEKRYLNPSDVQMRLAGTIIRYQGEPFWVMHTDGMLVYGNILTGDLDDPANSISVDSSDVELDISSPPLGMMNHGEWGPCYVMRGPRRSQRQGVNPSHLLVKRLTSGQLRNGVPFGGFSDRQAVDRMIKGEHPTFHSLVAFKRSGTFHRRWAVTRSNFPQYMFLYHKTRCVGFVNVERRVVNIPKNFFSKTRMMELSDTIMNQGDFHVVEIA